MNRFEELIAKVAPTFAVRRARARMALDHVRAYEAAAKGRRTDGWKTGSTSANAETRTGLAVTRARARDLVRNNPYASRGVSVIAANMVGYGIKTTPQTANKKTSPKLLKAWQAWAESTQCDADGQRNMYGLQEVAVRCVVESGEALVRRVWRKPDGVLAVPMQIQVLEPDFIDSSKDGKNGNNIVVQGIEYDATGKRVGYWLFPQHPGDGASQSNLVSAADVLHVYRADRAGQVRGITWFAPVVLRLRDFDEYEDAQLVRQKIAACFTAFVYESEAGEATGGAAASSLITHMEPGLIEKLGPGQNVTLASPPSVQGYSEYTSVTLHGIAVGLGVPYESLTGDYSQVNFTSGRMGRSEFHALLDTWQWNMFVPKFCGGVFGWFLEAGALAGLSVQGATAKYTPPRRILVDPTREIPTIIKAVRGGISTMPLAIDEMGYDPEEFLDSIEEWNAQLDKRGIILDSDPRKVSNAGLTQARPAGSVVPGDEVAADDAASNDNNDASKSAA